MQNLKRSDPSEFIYKTETGLQTHRMNPSLPAERMGGRESQGVWDPHVHTAVFKNG